MVGITGIGHANLEKVPVKYLATTLKALSFSYGDFQISYYMN